MALAQKRSLQRQVRIRPLKKFKSDYQEDRNEAMSLNDFPAEVLLEILKYIPCTHLLKNVARVSKKFYSLTLDPSIPVHFRITRRTKMLAAEAFLRKRFRQITSIVIYQVMDKAILDYLAPTITALPRLADIKMSLLAFELPDNLLPDIFAKGTLKKLVVVGQRMIPDLRGLERCSELRHLQLDHVMPNDELKRLSNLGQLRVLELTASIVTSLEEFVDVFHNSQWSSLEELTLTLAEMNSQCLEALARKCPKLKKLWIYSMSQNKAIESSAVDLILKNCQQLRFFFLSFKNIEKTLKGLDQVLVQKYLLDHISGLCPHVTFSRK